MLIKSIFRTIKKSIGRYIAILSIIALGVGFFAGLRVTEKTMIKTANKYLSDNNLFDYRLISTLGITKEDIEALNNLDFVKKAYGSISLDFISDENGDADVVYHAHMLLDGINGVVLKEGRLPENDNEILLDGLYLDSSHLGRKIIVSKSNSESVLDSFKYDEYIVVGLIYSSEYINYQRGNTSLANGSIGGFVYMPEGAFKLDIYTEAFLDLNESLYIYSDEYNNLIDSLTAEIESCFNDRADIRYETIYSDAQKEIDDAMKEFDSKKQEFEDAIIELDDAKRELDQKEQELLDGKKELEDAIKEFNDKEKEFLDANKELEDAIAEFDEKNREFENAKQEFDKSVDLIEYNKGVLDNAELELIMAKEEYQAKKEEAEAKLEEAEANLNIAWNFVQYLNDQMNILGIFIPQEYIDYANTLYSNASMELEIQKSEAKKQLDDAKERINQAEIEIESGWEQVYDGQEQARKAKVELDNAKVKLDEARIEIEKGKSEIADAKIKLEEARIEIENAKSEIVDGDNIITDAKKEILDAESKIADGRIEIEDAENKIEEAKEELSKLERANTYVLDRNSNIGYSMFKKDSQIVSGISKVFPLFFFLVAALVCITTMTRMIGEQRTQNGILKALGYNNAAIVSQYLIYAGSASVFGCVMGFLVGSKVLPLIIWKIYEIMYSIRIPTEFLLDVPLFIICSLSYLACILGVTYFVCRADLKTCAAGLMRPKAPGTGKRIILERIGFVWNNMKFLHKVSARNILRYKKRMIMMIIGIGGCTALLIAGFGIRDSIQPIVNRQYGEIDIYDAVANLKNEISKEQIDDFKSNIKDYTKDYTFTHSESLDFIVGNDIKGVSVITYFDENISHFIDLHIGKKKISLPNKGEIVINNSIATEMDLSVGDSLIIRNSDYKEVSVLVSGIYENYIGNVAYISSETFKDGFGSDASINQAYFIFNGIYDHQKSGASIMGNDIVASVNVIDDLQNRVGGILDSLNLVVLIVIVCAGALAFIVLYNLTNITITERTREIATLKVLGFRNNEQDSYVFRENIILTIISSLFGIPLGILLLQYVMTQIKVDGFFFGWTISFISLIWAIFLTILFAIVVDAALIGKLKKINMAEAMKAIE